MRKMLMAFAVLTVGLGWALAGDNPGEEAIREAITILEARKAQAEKKDDKDKIARAVADLEKLLPAAKKDGAEAKADPDLAKLVTPALLKKRLAGKAAFNPKTGELTLVYDFKDKDQLKDFDLGDAKPVVAKGAVALEAATDIQHVAVFKTLTVTWVVISGKFVDVRTTSKVRVFGWVSLIVDGQGGQEDIGVPLQGATPFKLTVSEKRVALEVGAKKGGMVRDVPQAGQLILGGGSAGNQFSKLTLTGKVDEAWAKEFFKD